MWNFWTDFHRSPKYQISLQSVQWEQRRYIRTDERTDKHDEAQRHFSRPYGDFLRSKYCANYEELHFYIFSAFVRSNTENFLSFKNRITSNCLQKERFSLCSALEAVICKKYFSFCHNCYGTNSLQCIYFKNYESKPEFLTFIIYLAQSSI